MAQEPLPVFELIIDEDSFTDIEIILTNEPLVPFIVLQEETK